MFFFCFFLEYLFCVSIEIVDCLICGWVNIVENDCKNLGCCYEIESGVCFKIDG